MEKHNTMICLPWTDEFDFTEFLIFFPLGNKYLMLDPFYFFPSVPKSSVQEMTC